MASTIKKLSSCFNTTSYIKSFNQLRFFLFLTLALVFSQNNNVFSQNECKIRVKIGDKSPFYSSDIINEPTCVNKKNILIAEELSGAKYQWYFEGKLLKDSVSSTLLASENGTYWVVVKTNNCESISPKMTISYVKSIPNYIIQEDDTSIWNSNLSNYFLCSNNLKLNVFSTNIDTPSPTTYTLVKDGIDLETKSSNSFLFNSEGEYFFRINKDGCQINTHTFKVERKNSEIKQNFYYQEFGGFVPDTVEVCKDLSFDIYAPINKNSGFNWFFNESPQTNVGKNQKVDKEGYYRLQYKNSAGCDFTSTVYVKVVENIKPPQIVSSRILGDCNMAFVSLEPKFSDLLYFTSKYKNTNLEWYKFYKPYLTVPASLFSGRININGNENGALYKVEFDWGNCRVSSDIFTFLKSPNGKNTFKLEILGDNAAKSREVCSNSSFFLRTTAFIPNKGIGQIEWYKDNKLIKIGKDYVSELEVSESGKYYSIVRNDPNCVFYSDTLNFDFPKAFPSNLTQSISDCSFKLSTIQTENVNYLWKKNGIAIQNSNRPDFTTNEAGSYTLVMSRGNCTYETNPTIVGSGKLVSKNEFCVGESILFDIPKADTYLWSGPNGFSSTLQNPIILNSSLKNSGEYSLRVTKNGCQFEDKATVIINQTPEFNLNRTLDNCLGSTFKMSAETSNFYFWSWDIPNQGKLSEYSESLKSIIIPKVTKNDEGNYKITAYSEKCSKSISTQLTILDDCTEIILSSPPKSICRNGKNTFSFKLVGNFAEDETYLLYTSFGSGTKFLLASTKSKEKITFTNNGYNSFFIEAQNSKIQSNIINTGLVNPTLNFSYKSLAVCDGYTVPITLTSQFDKVQWFYEGIPIQGATKPTIEATKSGIYDVSFELGSCVMNSSELNNNLKVTIGKIPVPSIIKSGNLCNGAVTINYFGSSSELKDFKYQWQLDGNDIPNAQQNFITVSEGGKYTLKTFQGNCSATSLVEIVKNKELFQPSIYVVIDKNVIYTIDEPITEICDGMNVELLTYQYTRFDSRVGDFVADNVSFQWIKDGIELPNSSRYRLVPQGEGEYRLKVIMNDCVVLSNPIRIKKTNITSLKLVNLGFSQVCGNESVRLMLNDKFALINKLNNYISKVKLYKGNNLVEELPSQKIFTVNESGRYSAIVDLFFSNSSTGCTIRSDSIDIKVEGTTIPFELFEGNKITTCLDSIQINAKYIAPSFQPTYKWKMDGVEVHNSNLDKLVVRRSAKYELEINTINGCKHVSKPLDVEFGKLEASIFSASDKFCDIGLNLYAESKSYTSFVLNGLHPPTNRPLEFSWELDGKQIGANSNQQILQSGNYVLNLKQGSCVAKASKRIEVVELSRTLSPNIDTLFLCPNSSGNISSIEAEKYIWLFNKNITTKYNTFNLISSETGNYRVWLEKEGCGRVSNSINFVNKIILPTATISGGKEINIADSTKLKVDLTSSPPWMFKLTNGQEFTATQTPFEFLVKPTQSTVYELASVKNNCGEGSVSGKAEVKIIILGNENLDDLSLSIYPNPFSETIQIVSKSSLIDDSKFEIYDMKGKLLIYDELPNENNGISKTVNVRHLPDGTYIIKVLINNKIITRILKKLK